MVEHSAEERPEAGTPDDEDIDPVLRAKYLDFCSARISEIFLSLSDERIYELAEAAAEEANLDVGTMSFGEMVRLVTERLRADVPLPDLATWAREYSEDPDRYDDLLLGFWEDADATERDSPPDDPEDG